jgi:ABC-2 type transport system permease protein
MSLSARRVRAVFRKELREYRRNASIVAAMAILPLVFLVQPLVVVFSLPASSSGQLAHEHLLLYLLGIPALVPVLTAAHAVVSERQQGTLEPVLTTPVRNEEFLLGKALASLVPSVVVAYVVYAVFLACVRLFADPTVASALLQWPQILAQVLFTPPIAAWSIWVALGISAKSNDIRVSQQLGLLAGLPTVVVTSLIAFNAIHPTPGVALGLAAALVFLDGLGWRIVSPMFNRERLITGTH